MSLGKKILRIPRTKRSHLTREALAPTLKGLRLWLLLEQFWHSLSFFSHTHVAFEGLCLFDLFLFFSDRVSSSDWPQTCYPPKNDLGFLILQHLPPTPWDYKCEPPRLVYAVMGPPNRALCTLGKLSTETQS